MFIYGDYGQFTFDKMTWLGSVQNLPYDNVGYLSEKLRNKESYLKFDERMCKDDILDWLRERLEDKYDLDGDVIENVLDFMKDTFLDKVYFSALITISEWTQAHNLSDIGDLLNFTVEAFENADEYDWISWLRNSNIDDFDESYDSTLWDAGKEMDQKYYICLYALKVCGEKLEAEKQKSGNETKETESEEYEIL